MFSTNADPDIMLLTDLYTSSQWTIQTLSAELSSAIQHHFTILSIFFIKKNKKLRSFTPALQYFEL